MRALLAAALLALTSCAPLNVVPAVGTSLAFESCGQTSQGVVVRHWGAPCPDMRRLDERARRVKAAYRGCSLDGVQVHVVDAYVMCGEEPVRGCTTGSLVTVTNDRTVLSTTEHELAHVCIEQVYGVDSLRHFFLDHPDEAQPPPRFGRD